MKKILKMMGLVVLGVALTLVIGIALFVNFSPQFGGSASKEQKLLFANSENYTEGKFVNKDSVNLDMSIGTLAKIIKMYMNPVPNTSPKETVSIMEMDSSSLAISCCPPSMKVTVYVTELIPLTTPLPWSGCSIREPIPYISRFMDRN